MAEDFYEKIADDYERMTDEADRLNREIPFLLKEIKAIGGSEVLDVGCGTGSHARALAAEGIRVVGIDTSPAMIEKAQARPHVEGARFEVATIAEIAARSAVRFDTVLCLGNTLPHLITEETSLAKVSRQIATLLRRGGVFIGQIVNVTWVEATGVRLMPVRSWNDGGKEVLLSRHYVNTGGSMILMLVSHLMRRPDESTWRAETFYQYLQKIVPMEIERAFESGPWGDYRSFGGWGGEPLDETSPSAVFVTTRR